MRRVIGLRPTHCLIVCRAAARIFCLIAAMSARRPDFIEDLAAHDSIDKLQSR